MRREGRPHGMVRAYSVLPISPWNPRGDNKFNKFDTPTTAGMFTKVSSKPTNHSKFTGKCGKARCSECHMQPSCKAKDKTKGSKKEKSQDVLSNCNAQLISWRFVDGHEHGSNLSGFSATGMLDQLGSTSSSDHEYVDDDQVDEIVDDEDKIYRGDCDNYIKKIGGGADQYEYDDGILSYCEVGFEVDQAEGDEDWCLVAERS